VEVLTVRRFVTYVGENKKWRQIMVERSFTDPVKAESVQTPTGLEVKKWWQEREGIFALVGCALGLVVGYLLCVAVIVLSNG
jgi:hypothetical protein